jgi:predicted DCC family thiol-disulfide oxidoreductase YuxK
MDDADRPVVIFDGVCNLCSAVVRFVLDHDRRGRLLLAASQGEAGRALLARHPPRSSPDETLFLVERGRIRERSAAALGIARALGFPWSLLYALVIVPRPIRDALYDFVARRRYRWFGRSESCRLPREGEAGRFL